jgi:tripartite-type tricarboxylate transporter receptor subunit TctC
VSKSSKPYATGLARSRTIGLMSILACGAIVVATVVGAAMSAASEPPYPSRPIRMLVGFSPGGGSDVVARILGNKLSDAWKQQVVVDNRAGAGGVLASEITARAAPNGYTLFLASQTHGSNPAFVKNLPYDSIKDFAPITLVVDSPFIFVAYPGLGVNTIQEFISRAKAQPGRINYGSSGLGSGGHLAVELLKWMTGINLTHVPYKGGAPALIDLIGGQIQIVCTSPLPAWPYVRSGKLRALAMTGRTRSQVAPEIQTVAESGVPGYQASIWYALLAPAGTPRGIINKLHSETVRAIRSPDMNQQLLAQGADPVGNSPQELEKFIRAEIDRWTRLIQQTNIHAE